MIDILKQAEALPQSYPAVTLYENDDFSGFGNPVEQRTVDVGLIWQRIESYIAHRWTQREVI